MLTTYLLLACVLQPTTAPAAPTWNGANNGVVMRRIMTLPTDSRESYLSELADVVIEARLRAGGPFESADVEFMSDDAIDRLVARIDAGCKPDQIADLLVPRITAEQFWGTREDVPQSGSFNDAATVVEAMRRRAHALEPTSHDAARKTLRCATILAADIGFVQSAGAIQVLTRDNDFVAISDLDEKQVATIIERRDASQEAERPFHLNSLRLMEPLDDLFDAKDERSAGQLIDQCLPVLAELRDLAGASMYANWTTANLALRLRKLTEQKAPARVADVVKSIESLAEKTSDPAFKRWYDGAATMEAPAFTSHISLNRG